MSSVRLHSFDQLRNEQHPSQHGILDPFVEEGAQRDRIVAALASFTLQASAELRELYQIPNVPRLDLHPPKVYIETACLASRGCWPHKQFKKVTKEERNKHSRCHWSVWTVEASGKASEDLKSCIACWQELQAAKLV